MSRRANLGPQFAGHQAQAPLKRMATEEVGRMLSANTEGRTSVAEWADALPDGDRRASKVRGYIDRTGEIPGFLSVSPEHGMLMDGHHRYKEARDAGIPYVHVLDDPDDPRFKSPN
jgi:hypothetical protein